MGDLAGKGKAAIFALGKEGQVFLRKMFENQIYFLTFRVKICIFAWKSILPQRS